jgi:hypothetical protein
LTIGRSILLLCVVLCAAINTESRILATLSIRILTVEADVIVEGDPVVSASGIFPLRYRVGSVLKGPVSLLGQELILKDDDHLYNMSRQSWMRDNQPLPRITTALLFLRNPPDGREGYALVASGIRALADDGTVLVPSQAINPGPYHLSPTKDQNLVAMIAQVQQDLPVVEHLRSLKDIPDRTKRNQAIFGWIEDHKKDFEGGYLGTDAKGWGPLDHDLFSWILESCIPEDCWRAIELEADLRTWSSVGWHPSFCSTRGRELLLTKIFDAKASDSVCLRALGHLGSLACWYANPNQYPGTCNITQEEQKTIIRYIIPLLKHKDSAWRKAAVMCLQSVSWPCDARYQQMLTKQAVPDLSDLYRTERNAEVRDEIIETLRRLEDDAFWQNLTGNPHGMVVYARFNSIYKGVVEFHPILKFGHANFTEPPVFRFEKLAEDGTRAKSELIKPSIQPPDLAKAWADGEMVTMTVPASQFEPGRWRVTLEGRCDGQPWHSEPIEITVPEKKEENGVME